MKRREQILAGALGAFLLLYGGNWALNAMFFQPLAQAEKKNEDLRKKIADRQRTLGQFSKANQRLAVWQTRSLPSDAEVAKSLYLAWLVELVERAGFLNPNLNSLEPVSRKGMYESLGFTIRGRAQLDQLTAFLFEFYQAGHLHQISSITITPLQKGDEIDFALSIEALVLPTADRRDRLTSATADRLALNTQEAYRPIVDRNLFGAGGSGVDPTDQTYLTAVIEVDGEREAWFTARITDTVLKLRLGELIDVGPFHGTIAEIDGSDVIIASEEERWLITVGENLAHASTLPPEY